MLIVCVLDFCFLGTMGGAIFLSIIQHFSIPVDSITCFLLLFNFTILGTLSVFSGGMPIVLRQCYMVVMGIVVAAWFTKLPEWTTWFILVALALYDLVAVLAPGGPLKLLVELASTRDEELPAMVYEARPIVSGHQGRNRGSSLRALVGGGGGGVSDSGSVELQAVRNHDANQHGRENSHNLDYNAVAVRDIDNVDGNGNGNRDSVDRSPLVGNPREGHFASSVSSEHSTAVGIRGSIESRETVADEEMSPLVELMGWGDNREESRGLEETYNVDSSNRGIKLGLGDFIFYSVLVGRAAMYDLMTVYACYLAIISGLGCTLILLSVYNRALPALPISIMLGVVFYFLTRLLMEPFVVGMTTNLMMF